MIPSQLIPFANHLWQSTLFAAVAGLLTLFLKRNRAHVRYWLWLMASVKFLLPFSVLMALGGLLGRHTAAAVAPSGLVSAAEYSSFVEQVSDPFTTTLPLFATPAVQRPYTRVIVAVLIFVWAIGFVTLVCRWTLRWRRVCASMRKASPLDLPIGLPVKSSPAFGEPGVFGVFRPVLLLPDKIMDCLTAREMESIVAHELCHVRRRDNLATVIHMAVEAVFWFHPLVWWLGARLIQEREQACDEEVLRNGAEPRVYAEGILKICEQYLASPLACVAGVTGGDLKRRINGILAGPSTHKLNIGRKLLLTAAGALAVAGPILVGLANAPRSRAQSQGDDASRLAFEVASVKLTVHGRNAEGWSYSDVKIASPGRLVGTNASLDECIRWAYGVKEYQISGPGWLNSDAASYDIEAKAPPNTTPRQMRLMLRTLLGERFKLVLHRDTKLLPVYLLKVGKNGPHLERATLGADGGLTASGGRDGVRVTGDSATMETLAHRLSLDLDHPVFDKTGIQGTFRISLEWAREGDGPSVFAALQERLGLRLEASKAPIEILVIDHAERIPAEN